jgi:hypothetical protein
LESKSLNPQDILQVIYAPQKAFKKIVENPSYLGAIILLVIFVVAQIGASTVLAQQVSLEQTTPSTAPGAAGGDAWTNNAALWMASSGINVTDNKVYYVPMDSSFTNQSSIQFTGNSQTSVTVLIPSFDKIVNCGANGYTNLSIRIYPNIVPSSASLTLYSVNSSSYTQDITYQLAKANIWNNLTVQLNNAGWKVSGTQATWDNITGIQIQFNYQTSQNVNISVDDLFFRGTYANYLQIYGSIYYVQAALTAVTPFLIMWLLFTGLIYLIIKGLKGIVLWKPLMAAIGLAMIPLIFQAIITIGVYSAGLPKVYYPTEVVINVPIEAAAANAVIANQLSFLSNILAGLQLAIYVWLAALGSFVVKELSGFNWTKSIMVASASVVLAAIISAFLSLLGF